MFYEDFPWTAHSVAHYDTFIKVDTFYYKVKDIYPSVWLQSILIAHDTNNFLHKIKEKSATLSYSPSEQEVEIWKTKFLANVHELYRRVMRKELYYSLHCLDQLRLLMAAGWYMEAGLQPNSLGDWSKLEGSRSKLMGWQLDLLEQWYSTREPSEIFTAVKSIISEFLKIHKSLCSKVDIDKSRPLIEKIINMVL